MWKYDITDLSGLTHKSSGVCVRRRRKSENDAKLTVSHTLVVFRYTNKKNGKRGSMLALPILHIIQLLMMRAYVIHTHTLTWIGCTSNKYGHAVINNITYRLMFDILIMPVWCTWIIHILPRFMHNIFISKRFVWEPASHACGAYGIYAKSERTDARALGQKRKGFGTTVVMVIPNTLAEKYVG